MTRRAVVTAPAIASGSPSLHADAAIDRTLQALAEPTRRAVVGLLRGGPQRAGDIAATLATSRQAMSRHLRVLRQAGVIREVGAARPEDDARARTYQLAAEPLAALQGWLGELQSFWTTQLDAFRQRAESVAHERAAAPKLDVARPAKPPKSAQPASMQAGRRARPAPRRAR